MLWLVIAIGGALGAGARHALNVGVHARFFSATFPAGIFIVNMVGCAVIGLLAGMIAVQRIEAGELLRAFLFVGVLGGFTTFSSFALDTLVLARGGNIGMAALNAFGQPVLGLAVAFLGYALGSWRR